MSRQKGKQSLLILIILQVSVLNLLGDEAALYKRFAEQAQQEVRRQERELEALKPQFTGKAFPRQAPESSLAGDEEVSLCFNRIDIVGTGLISKREQARLVQPYLYRELSVVELQALLNQITQWYVERGYSTARVGLKEESFQKRGYLKLFVQEGRVNELRIIENGKSRKRCNTVLPFQAGKRFQLREFEQGIDTVQRLSSLSARLEVIPLEDKAGWSDIEFKLEKQKPFQFFGGYDNEGSPTYGQKAMNIGMKLDDVMGLYDLWYIHYQGNRQLYKDRYNDSLQVFCSLPLGRHLVSVSYSNSKFLTTTQGQLQTIEFRGGTQTINFDWDYSLWRTAISKTQVSLGISHKRIRNEIQGQRQITGCRNLTSLQINLSHMRQCLGGWAHGIIRFVRGLRCNNLTSGSSALATHFHKWLCELTYVRGLPSISKRLQWRMQGFGQYSCDHLYGSETLSLGGPSSIRGFKEGVLSGECGAYLRNELCYSLDWNKLGKNELFLAYDTGKIFRNYGEGAGSLSGMSMGLRYQHRYINAEISLSRALHPQVGGMLFYFKLGYQF